MLFLVLLLDAQEASAQIGATDSTYLRIPDRAKALAAMRFDLDAYTDTLRRYRDALDHSAYRVDASRKDGEARQAQLGLLRRDAQELDKAMKRLRKQLKRTPPATEDAARSCGDLLVRTKLLRTRLVAEGVSPQ
jgi:hypothetical protein